MKKLVLIIVLISLFSSCGPRNLYCEGYCEGNILHTCEYTTDYLGVKSWETFDCEAINHVCGYPFDSARCMHDASRCIDDSVKSFCNNETVYSCKNFDGTYLAEPIDECEEDEACVESSETKSAHCLSAE